MRKIVSAAVSAALCIASLVPGMATAQEYRFTGFDAPQGATATVNLRVPLGRQDRSPSYGLTLGYGQPTGADLSGRTLSRGVNVADLRFSGDRLAQARVAGFDLANPGRDRRLNLMGGGGKKTWLLLGLIALGVFLCITEFCDSDDESVPNNPSTAG